MWQRLWFSLLQFLGRDPRGIFRYWDGRRWRCGDPVTLARSLMSHPTFDWDEHPLQVSDPDPHVSSEAIRVCAETVREVFGIPSLADGGLTESELCSVLWSFQEYLAAVKKNGNGQQIQQPPTESTPRFPGETYRTKPDSDSGSTPSGPAIAIHGT